MFLGEYLVQLGEKNRVAIPKKLRDLFEGKAIVTRGYEKCLILVDNKGWDFLINDINKNPLLSINLRDTKRFLLGGATEIDYDSQGRFVLPEGLKDFAKIEDKVVFIGVGEWIEIWSQDRWTSKLEDLAGKVSDIAERLSS